ncbi:hypothetical protein FRB90_000705 [Tulasnella sp. 427]|nr:hypothetical protein FRB90_000705 [Tulasnella sp. 427]
MVLLVFPLLRRITYPPVASVTEALDLVHQTLESFYTNMNDCAFGNIMMDGRALFPSQWHPQLANIDLQNKSHRTTKSRTDVGGVRYYFTDFGLSTKGEHLVTGLAGLEDAPELSDRIPYDPFKLDIYILGMMFQRKIIDEFYNAAILAPLVQRMTARDPGNRPSASEAQAIFRDLQLKLDIGPFSERLIQKPEGTVARAIGGSRYWLRGQWARFGSKPQLPPFE